MTSTIAKHPMARFSVAGVAVAALLAACGDPDPGGEQTGRNGQQQNQQGDPREMADQTRSQTERDEAGRQQATRPQQEEAEARQRGVTGRYAANDDARRRQQIQNREQYQHTEQNPVRLVTENPVSTFSVDVDTGSYTNVRRMLRAGQLPPVDAVRVEEMVNYFSYNYELPADRSRPFNASTEVARTPWNENTYLLRVGIRGYDVPRQERPASNLVFLVDVSGSMNSPDKLPLVVASLRMLTQHLNERDRVSIVVYSGAAGVVLEPTAGNETAEITAALERLKAGGSTAGGEGIRLAYAMARRGFIEGGVNRVILATDGDFNVGITDREMLMNLVERQRESGITLTTLGFGTGNYNEYLMERIADVGNGNYAYIDSIEEARKVLVEEMSSTLFTIAQDVKIQIEFNPGVVAEYRLIGYENRMLRREDFNNDRVDAGDIGAGHTVTALYEITLRGSDGRRIEDLRYGNGNNEDRATLSEFAHLRLRYKLPGESESRLIEEPLMTSAIEQAEDEGSPDMRFAAAVAAYGQLLKGGRYLEEFDYDDVVRLAREGMGEDERGYRAGFIRLVEIAKALTPTRRNTAQSTQ